MVLSPDPTFYVDAGPDPDPTISYKFVVNFSQQCRFKFFSFLDSVMIFILDKILIFSGKKCIHIRIRSGSAGLGFRCRSVSGNIMPIRSDPDPQSFFETTSRIAVHSAGCVEYLGFCLIFNNTNPVPTVPVPPIKLACSFLL